MFYQEEFIYCNNPNDEVPILNLIGSVGEYEAVCGALFANEIKKLESAGKKKIKILINSTGGSVFDGIYIYTAIDQSKMEIETCNAGVAISIAAVIFLAGNIRSMWSNARIMIHNPYNLNGSVDKALLEMQKMLNELLVKNNIILTEEEIAALMENESWIRSEEALKLGFATEIFKSPKDAEQIDTMIDSKKSINAHYEFANLMMNRYIPNIDINMNTNLKDKEFLKFQESMKNSALVLNNKLVNESSEDTDEDDEDADERRENYEEDCKDEVKLDTSHVEKVTLKNEDVSETMDDKKEDSKDEETEMEDKEKEMVDLKNQLKNALEELNKFKDLKSKEEKDIKDKKISNVISEFIRTGKLKNDENTIKVAKMQLEKDFDNTMILLNAVKPSKMVAKLPIENAFDGTRVKGMDNNLLVAKEMEKLREEHKKKNELRDQAYSNLK